MSLTWKNLIGVEPLWSLVLALKHGCTSFTGLPLQWKRVYRTFSTLKQACTNVTIPSHGWKWLKYVCWHWNIPAQGSNERKDGLDGFIGPSRHENRLAQASQHLQMGQKCFTNLSWRGSIIPRASLDLQRAENGFIGPFQHIHSLARASQHLHMGEKAFTDLFWHWNMPAQASNDLQDG